MKTSSKLVLGIAALLLLIAVVMMAAHNTGPPLTPEQEIVVSLHDAQQAAEHRNLDGVMELISDDFHGGSWTKPRLQLYLSREMNNSRGMSYDVHVNAPRILPAPNGDPNERMVVTQASVFWADTGEDIWGTNPVTLVMRRETRRHWIFFTQPEWRVVGVGELSLPGADDFGV
jgi:hypothetical protein